MPQNLICNRKQKLKLVFPSQTVFNNFQDTLTEQLVQLIQLNEERKLGKLEELTFKLSMDPEVVAKRETEAAEKLKLEELELQKKKDEERQARLGKYSSFLYNVVFYIM